MTLEAISRALTSLLYAVSVAMIFFIAGATIMEYRLFPFTYIRQLFDEVRVQTYARSDGDPYLWRRAAGAASGVARYDPARAFPGLTLITSADAPRAVLMTMGGEVVHRWALPYSAVWTPGAAVRRPLDDKRVIWRKAVPFPNGDLLVVFEAPGDVPWGYGLAKIDKDSNVLWSYLERAHGDVSVGADGRVFALVHDIRRDAIPGLDQIKPSIIEDRVVVLSPDGRELASLSLFEAFRDSDYAPMMNAVPLVLSGDYLHANGIEVISAEAARRLPMARGGEALVSLRNLDTLIIVDLERAAVSWALRGPWREPHDPDVLADGTIAAFDAAGHYGPGGRSRVVALDPASQRVDWLYAGDESDILDSRRDGGGQQRLANGNTLITDTGSGRVIEVTGDGAIVWEYLNPHRSGRDGRLIAIVTSAERFAADWFEFPFSPTPQPGTTQ